MSQVQIKNILDKKLKKDYQIIVSYAMIDERIDAEVLKIQKTYKIKGFRPGQVPVDVIKQKYESSIMAEESQKIINETSKKIVDENELKLALAPKVDVETFEPKKDFKYTVSMELFPEVPQIELDKLKLVKKEVAVAQKDIDEAKLKITANHKEWDKKDDSYKAKKGDAVNIDYVGKIDGKEFDGGSAKGHQLEIGSKSFIDNFEDQLVGKKAGDEVKVKVKFPKEYHSADFAGKKAEFEVKVNSILVTKELKIDNKFVKEKFGVDDVKKFEEEISKQISSGYESMSRSLFKKDLFDLLNKKFNFELPSGLVEEQLERVWAEIEQEIKQNPDKFKNEKEENKAKEEKRKLSDKMVRSGIILSNISQENKITVADNEIMSEVNKKAAQFPGQEQMVADYYQKNPQAVQEIRGMLLEEKVVTFILGKAKVEIKKTSLKDLEKELNKS
jgi:trigger factor